MKNVMMVMVVLATFGCDGGDSSGVGSVGEYEVQPTHCPAVDVEAPCCEPPTAEWVRGNCPSGATMALGDVGTACVSGDGFEGAPYTILLSSPGGVRVQGYDLGDGLYRMCQQRTGRLRRVVDNANGCDLECYNEDGFSVVCANPCD